MQVRRSTRTPEAFSGAGTPPLTDQLFDPSRAFFGPTLQRYGPLAALVPEVQRALEHGQTLEEALDDIQDDSRTWPWRESQLAAMRFYLRDVLRYCSSDIILACNGATAYAELVALLERWRYQRDESITYVTFNYDTLLEDALDRSRVLRLDRIDSYVSTARTRLVKLHGSADWAVRVHEPLGLPKDASAPVAMIEAASELQVWR